MRTTEGASCELPASGFTRTRDEVYDWAKAVVSEIRKHFGDRPISVGVWAYREQGVECVAADFRDAANPDDAYPMLFLAVGSHDFRLEDVHVPDLVEALHMIGIIADATGAAVSMGRRCNEVNRYCTPKLWTEGQTSGVLMLS